MNKELRDLIRGLVIEHIIEERFGQKIGQQPALVGVGDERDIAEGDLEESKPGLDKIDEDDIEEVSPPGREDQVMALKNVPGIDNPWAVAWSQHNRSKRGKKR